MTPQHYFRELRLRLVEVRAQLRTAKDMHELSLAEATQRAQPQGKNQAERDTALTLALAADVVYQQHHAALRDAEYEAERVEALLEAASDERRAYEWQIRARLSDGLFRVGVPSEPEYPDAAFDDTADEHLTRAGVAAYEDEDFPF